MIKKCPPQYYYNCLHEYLNNLHPVLLARKLQHNRVKSIKMLLHKFMDEADFNRSIKPEIGSIMPMKIYYVFSTAEHNLPHTICNIMILTENDRSQIRHEILHIYFRYNPDSKALKEVIKMFNLVKLGKKSVDYLIENFQVVDNPDTNTYYAWRVNRGKMIAKLLLYGKYKINSGVFTFENGAWRPAKAAEMRMYNDHIPFRQNEHPSEILAEVISI